MIYFDQAATSFPKPKEVIDEMVHMISDIGANPGRSGHKLERKAAKVVNNTRERVAKLFGCSKPNQCLFYQNASIALNQAIKGFPWKKGDHIITTSLEHNAVRRPLEYVKRELGVQVTYVDWPEHNNITVFEQAISPETKAVIVTHACNVTGHVLPLQEITNLAKQYNLITIVDGSQTAGHLPINMFENGIDILAFPGHKGLLGPQGIGVLLIEGNVSLFPIHHGGTGIYSEEIDQPNVWPHMFESGTLNTPGIAGFNAALKLYEQDKEKNVSRETFLIKKLLNELNTLDDVFIYSPTERNIKLPIIAFNIRDIPSQEIAIILDSHYNIAVRAGLHCNPLAHQTHNTLEQGMIRVSLNSSNTLQEIEQFILAIKEIIIGYQL